MKTHLYTLCWNEADKLEYFFRNYDGWVDRYIVFDDGSTDGSIEILKSRPRVELRRWRRKYPDSYLISQVDWANEIWKESRGCADWVIMVDIDEHLFVPRSPMKDLLERYQSQDITLVPALGFQILSEEFPQPDEHLVQSRTWGAPWSEMCKLSIFNPDMIEETNFSTGRHSAKPVGNLKFPQRDELLLFHYKYLGFERTLEKQNLQYANLGTHDTAVMAHYAWSRQELRNDWNVYLKYSGDMSWPIYNPDRYTYFYRWWRMFGVLRYVSRWSKRLQKFIRDPIYMIKRLKINIIRNRQMKTFEKLKLFIEEINRSPIRRKIYQLTAKDGADGSGGDTVIVSNGIGERGVLIQCQHSVDMDTLQGDKGVQKVFAAKETNENKYQKKFDAFVITNGKGFAKDAVEFAKNKKVELISGNELIEFISQVKVS